MFESFQVLMIAGVFDTGCIALTPAHTATRKATKTTKFSSVRRAGDKSSSGKELRAKAHGGIEGICCFLLVRQAKSGRSCKLKGACHVNCPFDM